MKANEVIRMRRKELKMTLKDIANAVGVSEATVSRPLRGCWMSPLRC